VLGAECSAPSARRRVRGAECAAPSARRKRHNTQAARKFVTKMLPYKIIKESATNGLRFENKWFELEQALEDITPASCFMEVDALQEAPKNNAGLHWKKREDDLLLNAIKEIGPCKWSRVAEFVPGKTAKQCCDRWRIHMNGKSGKNKFNSEDDAVLEKAVREMGHDWTLVAEAVAGKTERQCRDRYKNYLDPNINKSAYTKEEDEFILESAQLGHGWAKISASMTGRTDAQVKKRFHQLRRENRVKTETAAPQSGSDKKCVTNEFLEEDALQALVVQFEQPKVREINKPHRFKSRIVKEIKRFDNFNFISTVLVPFGKVHANNFHNFQKINKRVRGKVRALDLLCHETL